MTAATSASDRTGETEPARIKVVHLASGDLWAGAEAQICNLVKALKARPDIDVEVILLNDGELANRIRSAGIALTILDESQLTSWQIFRRVRHRLRVIGPCLLHTHRTKENVIGAIAALSCPGVSSLRTVHGRPEFAASKSIRTAVIRAADRLFAMAQSRIVAVSEELAVFLRGLYGPGKVVCIANGVDVAATRALAAGAGPSEAAAVGRRTVGFVGRLVAVKRLDLLLHAAAVLSRRHPDGYRFVIVGDGPLRETMQALAQRLEIARYVEFAGFKANALPTIAMLDCLVLCSDHEGMPMVVLEALALGTPVVAHAVGSLPELLSNERVHALVRDHDPDGYATAILRATREPRNASGGSLLPVDYDIATCAAKYSSLYRELIGRKAGVR